MMTYVRSLLSPQATGRGRALAARAPSRRDFGRLLAWTWLAALAPGLAGADAFERTWCEIDAGAFRLVTDYPREQAEAKVRLLHTFRPVAEGYLAGTPNARNPPLTIIVFNRARDFRRALGGYEVGGFMQPSFTESLLVVGENPNTFSDNETLLHEYVHYLLRTRTDINIPMWYDEGLAGMLSSVRVANGKVYVGEMPRSTLEANIRESRVSVADVLEAEDVWDWRRERIRGFYDQSRVLVHRLLLGQEKGRDDLRPALHNFLAGRSPSLTDALDTSAGALQRRLERYLSRNPKLAIHDAPPPLQADLPFRCLDDSEKTRRVALAIVHHNPEEAAERLQARVEEDPDNATLWTALSLAEEGSDNRAAALTAARRAVALAPEDNAAAVRLAGALVIGCILEVSEACRERWQESVPLLRAALRRDPTDQEAIFLLGLAYLYSGRAGDALNYLRIAHTRQPWAAPVNFYLGESYRLIGDARAPAYLQRARRWSPTELWRRLAEAGLELVE